MNEDEWMELGKRRERLHPDLEKYLMEGPVGVGLSHPLVQALSIDPDHAGQLNWSYQKKREHRGAAFEKEDWYTFIMLHERPYRLHAFMEVADEMPDKKFWAFLSMVWIGTNIMWRK